MQEAGYLGLLYMRCSLDNQQQLLGREEVALLTDQMLLVHHTSSYQV